MEDNFKDLLEISDDNKIVDEFSGRYKDVNISDLYNGLRKFIVRYQKTIPTSTNIQCKLVNFILTSEPFIIKTQGIKFYVQNLLKCHLYPKYDNKYYPIIKRAAYDELFPVNSDNYEVVINFIARTSGKGDELIKLSQLNQTTFI